jgi:hypothetical protein
MLHAKTQSRPEFDTSAVSLLDGWLCRPSIQSIFYKTPESEELLRFACIDPAAPARTSASPSATTAQIRRQSTMVAQNSRKMTTASGWIALFQAHGGADQLIVYQMLTQAIWLSRSR